MSNDSIPQTKLCKRCQQLLPLTTEFFCKTKQRKDGWYTNCRKCHNEYVKRDYRQAKDKRLAQKHEYYQTHKSEHAQLVRQWQLDHPDDRRAMKNRYRSKRVKAEGDHNAQDIQNQYERQTGKCFWCSKDLNGIYHTDHIIPLSRGGTNWPYNIVCACSHCNKVKAFRIPYVEWQPEKPLDL